MRPIAFFLFAAASLMAQAQNGALPQQRGDVTVALITLNDFHGAFVQDADQGIPGAPSVLQTIDSLKAVYPHHLTLSAGDNFGGSYFYSATGGQLAPIFFHEVGIRLSALGNHEFDDGQEALADKWSSLPQKPADWDITYLCANVYTPQHQVPDYAQAFTVEEIPLSTTKRVRVGLVGLLASSAVEQISARNIKGMTFRGDYVNVLDSLESLPEFQEYRQAEIRTLLMHIGTHVKDGSPRWNDKNGDELQKINSPLYQAFFTGHSHDPVCGYINASRTPVVQGWWHGNYVCVMKFHVDTVQMRVVGVEPEIVSVPLRSRNELSPHALRLQEQIDSLLQNTRTKGGVPLGTRLTTALRDMPHDRTDKLRLSEVGTLVCEGYVQAFRQAALERGLSVSDGDVVVGVNHFGGIRAGMNKGEVTVLHVGEVLPFQNSMYAYRVDGRLLHQLIEFGYHNERYGWLQASNLAVQRTADGHVRRLYHVSPAGKRKRIKAKTPVVLVADEFISGGGDGYSTNFFPRDRRMDLPLPAATDCFAQYLRSLPSIGGEH